MRINTIDLTLKMSCTCLSTENNKEKAPNKISSKKKGKYNRSYSIQVPRSSSILKGSLNIPLKFQIMTMKRKDAYGNEIEKGSKKHKVTFVDKVEKRELVDYSDYKESEPILSPEKESVKVYRINAKELSFRRQRTSSFDNGQLPGRKENQPAKLNCELCIVF